MKKDMLKLVKDNIMFSTGSKDMKEAIKWFEERRHLPSKHKTLEFFNQLVLSQVAILFKLLIDSEEVKVNNNVIVLGEVE